MLTIPVSLIIALCSVTIDGQQLSNPTITILDPGIRFTYPDSQGISLVAFNYSINKRVHNTDAGDFNVDVTSKTDGEWTHINKKVVLNAGDMVFYWMFVIRDGLGFNLLNQKFTVTEATNVPTIIVDFTEGPSTTIGLNTPTNAPTSAPTTPNSDTPTRGPIPDHCDCSGRSLRPPGADRKCTQYPCMIFNDEFDTLNLDIWEHEITAGGGGNWEFQYYTNNRTNSYTRNGKLVIKPTLTVDTLAAGPDALTRGSLDLWGSAPGDVCTGNAWYGCKRTGSTNNILNPIQSARLRSSRGFNFKYGKVEVRARMPKGDWLWPAIWMLPYRQSYGKWPASGEIDIVESRGNSNSYKSGTGSPRGRNVAGSTLHFGSDFWHNKWYTAHGSKTLNSGSFADGFHNYTFIWDENFIESYIDGDKVLDVAPSQTMWEYGGNDKDNVQNPWRYADKMAPFDQEFYFILNVAVGGVNYFPDSYINPSPKPWRNDAGSRERDFWNARAQWYPTWNPNANNGEDAAMEVDYIRVWKLKPDTQR